MPGRDPEKPKHQALYIYLRLFESIGQQRMPVTILVTISLWRVKTDGLRLECLLSRSDEANVLARARNRFVAWHDRLWDFIHLFLHETYDTWAVSWGKVSKMKYVPQDLSWQLDIHQCCRNNNSNSSGNKVITSKDGIEFSIMKCTLKRTETGHLS